MLHERVAIGLPSLAAGVMVLVAVLPADQAQRRPAPPTLGATLGPAARAPAATADVGIIDRRAAISAEPAEGRDPARQGAAQAIPLVDRGALVAEPMAGPAGAPEAEKVIKVAAATCHVRCSGPRMCAPFLDVQIIERSGELVLAARIGAHWWTRRLGPSGATIWGLDVYDSFASPAADITIVMSHGEHHAHVMCSVGTPGVPSCVQLQLGAPRTHQRMDLEHDGAMVLTGWRDDSLVHEGYRLRFE